MTHGRAVLAMVGVTLLWSIAGVVTRQLDAARSFEATFWRSAFTAAALAVALPLVRPGSPWRGLARAGWPVWASGLCWAVMYTAFMVALTLTTVANVLVTMALGPLLTALAARTVLRQRLAARTWAAIVAAGAGIAWMYGGDAATLASPGAVAGLAVAFAVPLAGAANWTLLQYTGRRRDSGARRVADDMPLALLAGALLSAAVTLPAAWPFAATPSDLGWLALLGTAQLALPCLIVVQVARVLPAPEIALLALLEVVFGVAWAWWGAGERPSASTLAGGGIVLGALLANEMLALARRDRHAER